MESDRKEIEEPYWEDDQPDMFGITDDLGTRYERGGAGGSGFPEEHIWTYAIDFKPAPPDGAKTLTVTHIAGSVVLDL